MLGLDRDLPVMLSGASNNIKMENGMNASLSDPLEFHTAINQTKKKTNKHAFGFFWGGWGFPAQEFF